MKTPVLETDRLILKPVAIEDAPAIQKYFNNWNIIKNLTLTVPWPYPDDGAETFLKGALQKVESGGCYIWGIFIKDGPDELVGIIDYRTEKGPDGGNRGNWLAEPFHGRGYMTEAIEAVQDFLFFEYGVDKMNVINAKINRASSRVQEKTGGTLIGYTTLEHRNGESETEIWEVTKESWAAYRGRDP